MSRFPLELIILVLEFSAHYSNNPLESLETLASCAEVCAVWRKPAQQLIFKHVQLHRFKQPVPSLRNFFDNSARGRVLRTYVRCVSMYVFSLRLHVCVTAPSWYDVASRRILQCRGVYSNTIIISKLRRPPCQLLRVT
jgi:hypothetical protein